MRCTIKEKLPLMSDELQKKVKKKKIKTMFDSCHKLPKIKIFTYPSLNFYFRFIKYKS